MPYYRIRIKLKHDIEKIGIRYFEVPYPHVERKVTEEAKKAFGEDNIQDIFIFRLPDDHPDVQLYIKNKPKQ